MRLFTTLEEAHSEIQRDLSKSPIVHSSRVQNVIGDQELREALDYSYSVGKIPFEPSAIAELGYQWGFYDKDSPFQIEQWLGAELNSRISWNPGAQTELEHPELIQLMPKLLGSDEYAEPDYKYTDRLRGSINAAAEVLKEYPDSRRAYVPIFIPEDSVRASSGVRIPCSLGYQALIRYVDDQPFLHLTYMERACDFDKFWLSDIWFARRWQLSLLDRLNRSADWLAGGPRLLCGNTTHFVTSLHSFINKEIY